MKNDEISKKRREEVALLFSAQNVLHSDFPPRITEARSDNLRPQNAFDESINGVKGQKGGANERWNEHDQDQFL